MQGRRERGVGQLDVLGNIHQHRAGSTGSGNAKGLSNGFNGLVGMPEQKALLGYPQRGPQDIHLLEGIGPEVAKQTPVLPLARA